MHQFLVICLAVLTLFSGARCQEDESNRGKLLASKSILNQYLVEGKDLTVAYSLYNVGTGVATDVMLRDASFPSTYFKLLSGLQEVRWDRIAAGTNVTHTVVYEPLIAGYFNFTSADVTYTPSEGEETQIVYSSAPGEGGVVSLKEFERVFSPHYADWGVFALMTLPSLGFPYLLWYQSHTKYASLKTKRS